MNIVVIYGGESTEHDVSIVSAVQLINNLNSNSNNIIPVYIDKVGNMYECKDYKNYQNLCKNAKVTFVPNSKYLYKQSTFGKYKKYKMVDFVFIVMHGRCGEDGTIASVLNMAHIPYSSSDIVGSAVCIDKAIFKNTMFGLGVNIVPYVNVLEHEYDYSTETVLDVIDKVVGYPAIIKPSKLGSSIGIIVVNTKEELVENIKQCFMYDSVVVVEKYVDILKEINIALFKYKGEYVYSMFEVPNSEDNILSFNDKYLKKGTGRVILPTIDEMLDDNIKDISKLVYDNLQLSGVVRFDYILDKNGVLYLNELNTIPGSMANYLYKDRGISYSELLKMLIESGFDESYNKAKKIHSFNSPILSNVNINKLNINK